MRRDVAVALLLAALPLLAFAPALLDGRLLGPGDGAALHFPMRAAVWRAYRSMDLPGWDPSIFCGTPLLAAYRPGAFYPPMIALSVLPPFHAFQLLVLGSLAAAAALTYLYVRRLGAGPVGAYLAGLSFALGPYLVGHLEDTATLVAAPLLPLLLWTAERQLQGRGGGLGLALATALLLVAGSPEAVMAGGALVAGRLLVAYFGTAPPAPSLRHTLWVLAAGVALAGPQIGPTLIAATQAGPSATGLATSREVLPGAMGLLLRYVSHTPAAALALAAGPLLTTQPVVRVLGAALLVSLSLQWGRPLAQPGALPLVFDLTLAVLGGLSLDFQWTVRRRPAGSRLRAHFLFFCLASAAGLSVSAAALGPLPQVLAGAVGVLALSLILYFSLASSTSPLRAGIWLLPLTVSFLLQPHGRGLWNGAPTSRELLQGTPTRESLDHVLGRRIGERELSLVEAWPRAHALDLAYGGLGTVVGRRTANGYDPMVSARTRALLEMGTDGTVDRHFLRGDPSRLHLLGIRWVQVPAADTVTEGERDDPPLDRVVEPGGSRLFPLPILPATAVTLVSSLSESVSAGQGEEVAHLHVRLASGREFVLPIRAGLETAEWAYDRPDVAARVRHRQPDVAMSWPAPGGFEGRRYRARLTFPGRYNLDALRIEVPAGRGALHVAAVTVEDSLRRRSWKVSPLGAYVSDGGYFREAAATPAVRLYELPGSWGSAWVVGRLRALPDEEEVLVRTRSPAAHGVDPRREALVTRTQEQEWTLPPGSTAGQAEVVRRDAMRLELRAEGPGLLVIAETWDPGWRVETAHGPRPVRRVNHGQLGVVLGPGTQHVVLRYVPPGLGLGLLAAALAAAGLGAVRLRAWRRGRARVTVPLSSGSTQGDP